VGIKSGHVGVVCSCAGYFWKRGDGPTISDEAHPARRPVHPGGATDILAREIAQKLKDSMGQPVVVENKPGASAVIGTEMVAKAAPDGYNLLLSTQASHAINVALFAKLPMTR